MANNNYWLKRAKKYDKLAIKEADKVVALYKKELVKTKKAIKAQLAAAIMDNKGITEYEKYRLESIISEINIELDRLFNEEEGMLNKLLISHYDEIYSTLSKELSSGVSFGHLSSGNVQKALAVKWSGANYSERIWERRRKLGFTVKEIITAGFQRGDSIEDMSRLLADKMDANLFNARRLIHTETRYIQTAATIDSFSDNKVEEYEYLALLDSKTSKLCRSLDGQIFLVSDARVGVNAPPMHCFCRSAIMPVIKR